MSDRLLMGPGPSNPYPEVTAALVHPVLGHLDPEFLGVLDSTMERLRRVFATANPLTLPLSGTGSAGMEASIGQRGPPGRPGGGGGQRGVRRTDVRGGRAVRCRGGTGGGALGHPDRPRATARRAPGAGGHRGRARRDLYRGAQRRGPARARARAMPCCWWTPSRRSAGCEVAVDRWGVDVAYSGTQKCLGVPPGLAPLTVSEAGPGAAGRSALQLVPRPEPPRPLRGRR